MSQPNKNPAKNEQSLEQPYIDKCKALDDENLLRSLPTNESSTWDFSHNDYLGLSRHPDVIAAANQATETWGTGSRASRLLAGNLPLFEKFESQIAADKEQPAALILGSGFQANASVLAALLDSKVLGQEPRVFSDRLNHSSFHQGCFAAGVRQHRYNHLNFDHLKSLLEKYSSCPRPKYILTETVFGMDGDMLDVPKMSKLANQYNAFLYLDEAHATGMTGPGGYGLSAHAKHRADLVMGTFSKALGSSGAYVACSENIKQFLINRCAGFIYSTAPSPGSVGAAAAAWKLIPNLDERREKIDGHANHLREVAKTLGISTGQSATNIVPLIVGDTKRTLAIQKALAQIGFTVSAIRPPTVPAETSRIRITVSASHSADDIDRLSTALLQTWGSTS